MSDIVGWLLCAFIFGMCFQIKLRQWLCLHSWQENSDRWGEECPKCGAERE